MARKPLARSLACFALLTLCAAESANAENNSAPKAKGTPMVSAGSLKILKRKLYEDFEGYRGLLPQTPWPHEGGFMVSPYGFVPEVSLDHIVKDAGDYAMEFRYRTCTVMPQAAVSRLYNPNLDWAGYDAVRFWLRPDGSGRDFTFFVLEKIVQGNKWFWEAAYTMDGTAPVIVTMPFSVFYRLGREHAPEKPFDWSLIEETAWWVRQGKSSLNPVVPSSVWIDSIEVVSLEKPLDHVVAELAPEAKPINDKILRIDFGGAADWIDAEQHQWLADLPSKHGVRFTLPQAEVPSAMHPELYRTGRRNIDHLDYPRSNGRYEVSLHFIEPDAAVKRAGQHLFSVNVEGKDSGAIDVFKLAKGVHRPAIVKLTVEVTDGKLNLDFKAIKGESVLSGIEIAPLPVASAAR
jgi:hypothetical protein